MYIIQNSKSTTKELSKNSLISDSVIHLVPLFRGNQFCFVAIIFSDTLYMQVNKCACVCTCRHTHISILPVLLIYICEHILHSHLNIFVNCLFHLLYLGDHSILAHKELYPFCVLWLFGGIFASLKIFM